MFHMCTIQPPCNRVFVRSVPIAVDDQLSAILITMAASSLFAADAMQLRGMIRRKEDEMKVLFQSFGTATNFLTLWEILDSIKCL